MERLRICIYFFYTLSVTYSLSVQMNESIEGFLFSNNTELRCSFEGREKIISLLLLVKNVTTNTFIEIAEFRPKKESVLLKGGFYLSERVTLSQLRSRYSTAALTFESLRCDDDATYQCRVEFYADDLQIKENETKPTNLIVAVYPTVPYIAFDNASILEGTSISFACSGNVGKPPRPFLWDKRSNGIIYDMYENVTTLFTWIPDSCSYNGKSILKIQVKAEDNDTVIRCYVNTVHGEEFYHETQPLNVYSHEEPVPTTPNQTKTEYGIPVEESTTTSTLIKKEGGRAITCTLCLMLKKITGNHNKRKYLGIVFGVIAGVLLMALITVIIVCLNINRKVRLTQQHNYDNLRLRECQGRGQTDEWYDGINVKSQIDVSQYENAADTTTDTRMTRGEVADYETNIRTGDEYEFADVANR